jgi:membrane associated rhomboid family serine protease
MLAADAAAGAGHDRHPSCAQLRHGDWLVERRRRINPRADRDSAIDPGYDADPVPDAATTVATTPHAGRARDWGLVLAAAGIACDVTRHGHGWDVTVEPEDAERATEALAAYDAETVPVPPTPPPPVDQYGRTWAGIAMAMLVALVSGLVGSRVARSALFRAGEARADAITAGEAWRTVTALTLHADAAHLVSNLATGALVATAVCWAVGPGVGAWLLLAAGAAGNWATALLHGAGHRAVGASTSIFGGVGVLVGLAIVRRERRPWVPLAAGLALLGFLGTGERADLLAHLFGFGAGVVAGSAVAPLPVLRSRPMQWLLALAALGAVGGCWLLAIEHAGGR